MIAEKRKRVGNWKKNAKLVLLSFEANAKLMELCSVAKKGKSVYVELLIENAHNIFFGQKTKGDRVKAEQINENLNQSNKTQNKSVLVPVRTQEINADKEV